MSEVDLLRKLNKELRECIKNDVLKIKELESKRVLFNSEQVISLAEAWKKYHDTDDMDDYSHGIVDGIEFVLFLYERCEK